MYDEKRINSPLLEKIVKFLKNSLLFIKLSVSEFKKMLPMKDTKN